MAWGFLDNSAARQRVWDRLAAEGVARFPFPPHGRISIARVPSWRPHDSLRSSRATFVVELLEPLKAVAAIAHHLARLADIAELLGQFQEPELYADDFLFLCHVVISVPPGRARSQLWVRTAPRPRLRFGNQQ